MQDAKALIFDSNSVKMWMLHKVEPLHGLVIFGRVEVFLVLKVKEGIVHDR
jgi:hypothetical protein